MEKRNRPCLQKGKANILWVSGGAAKDSQNEYKEVELY